MTTRWSHASDSQRHGFALLEAMLAVAIFALGIFSLGHCISKGLFVEHVEGEDARADRLLNNRAAEMEAGALKPAAAQEQIAGVNGGLTLTQTVEPAHQKDEHGQELANLSLIKLEAAWTSAGERQSRTLHFYVWSE